MAEGERRPIASRETRWAQRVAARLARSAVTPNAISAASALFAAVGGVCLWLGHHASAAGESALYLAAALCIQGRLLCNLFDGMVAIEGGKKTASGEIWNELPDRVSDTALLLGAGYGAGGAHGPILGWAAALLAMATAYVRLLGVAAGVAHDFAGPMAKQHRMAVLTLACLGGAVACHFGRAQLVFVIALATIAAGSLLTALNRARRIVRKLEGLP